MSEFCFYNLNRKFFKKSKWKIILKFKIIYDIKSEDFGQRHFILSAPGNILVDVIQVISPSKEYEDNYE